MDPTGSSLCKVIAYKSEIKKQSNNRKYLNTIATKWQHFPWYKVQKGD